MTASAPSAAFPPATAGAPVRVGLLGVGTVGSAFAQLLRERPGLVLGRALVRDLDKPRRIAHPERTLTTDAEAALDADVVVELMGGTGRAAELMLQALAAGRRVVTANKAALAERWSEFAPAIREGRVYFEAAVMAGTPVLGPLAGALRGSRPLELHAILNGTCTHVLTLLEQGVAFRDAVREAQRLGYAEADPSLDIDGLDAAHKLLLLARLAFDPAMGWDELRRDTHGIREITPAIAMEAMEDGGRVRLVGSIVPEGPAGRRRWRARVRPVYLPAGHPLAADASNRNALVFRGDAVGEVVIAGPGAGALPTASAVLADVLAAAAGRPGPAPLDDAVPVPEGDPEDLGELHKA